jgi:hypothetical protein
VKVYIDESGLHDSSPVLALAGRTFGLAAIAYAGLSLGSLGRPWDLRQKINLG